MGFNRDQHVSCPCIEQLFLSIQVYACLQLSFVTHQVYSEFCYRCLSQFHVSLHWPGHLGQEEVRDKDHHQDSGLDQWGEYPGHLRMSGPLTCTISLPSPFFAAWVWKILTLSVFVSQTALLCFALIYLAFRSHGLGRSVVWIIVRDDMCVSLDNSIVHARGNKYYTLYWMTSRRLFSNRLCRALPSFLRPPGKYIFTLRFRRCCKL